MTFHTYHSNRVEALRDRLVDEMFGALPTDPLAAEQVLVDNRVLGDWLNIQIAQQRGIAANIHYLQPHQLFWTLARHVLGGQQVPQTTPLSKAEMTWKLYGLLGDTSLLRKAAMAPVSRYLSEDEASATARPLKQYQLASGIADLFDQYLVYRPAWINSWSEGKALAEISSSDNDKVNDEINEPWQRLLWQHLSDQSDHRAAIESRLLQALDQGDITSRQLPMQRLFVFGMTTMPPGLMDMLMLLGKHIPVYVYILNPCEHFWFDIRSRKELLRLAEKKQKGTLIQLDAEKYQIGNPLLASQGMQVREFLGALYDKVNPDTFVDDEGFVPPGDHTLLQAIQQEILNLEYRNEIACLDSLGQGAKRPLPEADCGRQGMASLHIHRCHSTMREVEVLHDQVRDILARHRDIQPRDIVVMMPRVAPYVGAIHAVFNSVEPAHRLDYHITDRSQVEESPLLNSFMALLKLPESRLPLSEVIALLEVPAVQKRFGFDGEAYATLKRWLVDSGVRWGWNAAHRQQLGLPAYAEASWQFGMDRLMAGYALQADEHSAASLLSVNALGLQPYDHIEGSNSYLFDQFLVFWQRLEKWRDSLHHPATPAVWADHLRTLLDDFFVADEEQEHLALKAIRSAIQVLDEAQEKKWFGAELPLPVIRDVVKPALEQSARVDNHWREGVKFCSLMPMRGVPFKVVYIMGMNMEDYPRRLDKRSFDLMRNSHRAGDRASRVDDRWLFLEALLSARQYFHVSYVGKDIHRNEKREPSVVLSELIDYCQQGYALPENYLLTEHPLQPFGKDYFRVDKSQLSPRLLSYNREACQVANIRQQPRSRGRQGDVRWQGARKPDVSGSVIPLHEFVRFFTKPWDWFFSSKHRVWLALEDEQVDDEEKLGTLDGLEEWQLRDDLIGMVNGGTFPASEAERDRLVDTLMRLRQGEGRWPLGYAGNEQAAALRELSPDFLWASQGAEKYSRIIEIGSEIGSAADPLRIESSFLVKDNNTVIYHSASKARGSVARRLELAIRAALAFQGDITACRAVFLDSTSDVPRPPAASNQAFLDTLAKLYLDYQETGLPLEPDLSQQLAALDDEDVRDEMIEEAWYQEKREWSRGGIIFDSKKRSYYGHPDALACATFQSVSERVWAAVNTWYESGEAS